MDNRRYTVTIHAAAPGTPIRGDRGAAAVDISAMDRSLAGHVFYTITDGVEKKSWGFAPESHGDINGPGRPFNDDDKRYADPFFERTMEISKDQYDKLYEFGPNPDRFGFDLNYKDFVTRTSAGVQGMASPPCWLFAHIVGSYLRGRAGCEISNA